MTHPKQGALAILLLLIFATGGTPRAAKKDPLAIPPASVKGRVFQADGKSALAGVRVRSFDLSAESEGPSAVTDGKGRFEIGGLPHGYFDLAVETPEGLFVADQVVNVPPGGTAKITLTIGQLRGAPSSDSFSQTPGVRATALLDRELTQREFWRSAKGIAILSGIGGGALLFLATSDDSTSTRSNALGFR